MWHGVVNFPFALDYSWSICTSECTQRRRVDMSTHAATAASATAEIVFADGTVSSCFGVASL
jgi:hypothetical protein